MIDPTTNRLRKLPDSARVWIYAAGRDLNDLEENRVAEILNDFCSSWQSHGRPVESAAEVIDDRFAVIAGRIVGGDISGCGIDASVHALEKASSELALEWLPALILHYRDDNGVVHSVSRREFRDRVRAGDVNADTRVFDLSIESLGQLRAGEFEQPAGRMWHARVFRIAQPAS